MIYQHLFDGVKKDKVVRAGLIGSGHFGTAIITQAQSISLLEIPIVADLDIEAARRAYHRAGITDNDIVVCDSHASAVHAIESGKFANWIAPPKSGIKGRPVDFEYVRL